MIAAIVLAAGSSTRMDLDRVTHGVTSKALLPLGSNVVLERVVGAVRRAGVDDVLVVTGHAASEVAPLAEALGARPVDNPDHARGMFTSVQAGVRALDPGVDAFFILPVDYALIPAEVLERLMHAHGHAGPADPARSDVILHPTCGGLRGHPPLIPARYRDELLAADHPDGLHSFFRRRRTNEHEVEVHDLTTLIDMDTPEDYARVVRFAAHIDRAAARSVTAAVTTAPVALSAVVTTTAGAPPAPSAAPTTQGLSDDDSRYLRDLLQPEEERVRHCETVAAVATALAERLRDYVPGLDVQLVRSAGFLHDMCKGRSKHALRAQHLLTGLGLMRLGEVVGAHMVMPPEKLAPPGICEEHLVYLADKVVVKDRVASIAERAERSMAKQVHNPDGMEAAAARTAVADAIAERVEALLGRPFEDVVLEIRASHSPTDC